MGLQEVIHTIRRQQEDEKCIYKFEIEKHTQVSKAKLCFVQLDGSIADQLK